MANPFKHPSTGVYYFRRVLPEELRPILNRGREWKVSLRTKDLNEARPRFAAESVRCEEAIRAARAQLEGAPRLTTSDAYKLADRWARSVLEQWEAEPESIADYVVNQDDEVIPASDFIESSDETTRSKVAAPLIADALRSQRLPLPPATEPLYSALVSAFFPRWAELCRLASQRSRGNWRASLSLPAAEQPLTVEKTSTQGVPKLSEVFTQWADNKRQTDGRNRSTGKTIAEFGTVVARFVELFGDRAVTDITRPLVLDFRTALGKLPTRGKGLRGLTAPQLISKAETEQLPTATLGTIKKQLRALSTVMGFAKKQLGVIQEDPVSASGLITQLTKAAQRADKGEAKDYSRSELLAIFSSPLYTEGWRLPRADYGEAFYWLPLLMLYTGARREELTQLAAADIQQDEWSSIWFIALRPSDENTVKTTSSRRKAPLHRDLIALGFIDYARSLPADSLLFPKLTYHPGEGYGHNFGKRWANYLREVAKVNSTARPSHGFRHSFKTICREVGIPAEVQDWITGHSTPGVGATYGSNPLRRMAEELEKFPSFAEEVGLLPKAGEDAPSGTSSR